MSVKCDASLVFYPSHVCGHGPLCRSVTRVPAGEPPLWKALGRHGCRGPILRVDSGSPHGCLWAKRLGSSVVRAPSAPSSTSRGDSMGVAFRIYDCLGFGMNNVLKEILTKRGRSSWIHSSSVCLPALYRELSSVSRDSL